MRILGIALPIFSAIFATAVQGAMVSSDGVNCRSAPSRNARVVERLNVGDKLEVLSARGRWTRVRARSSATCWVSTPLLGSAVIATADATSSRNAGAGRSAYALGAAGNRAYTTRSYSRGRKVSRPSHAAGISSGSCPCGSGSICVGPRGGRYCITSGGNKRYGM